MKRKICVVTGTRAEYGLLYWTMKGIEQSKDLELQVIATGMHLSPEFGNTYKIIENDGFNLNKKIEILISGDTSISVSKSIGLGVISFSEAFDELKPDIVLILGDRFEILSAAIAAMISKIPIAHCHGGESTEGLIDEAIRHAITKMSQIHFTSTNAYRNRIIQLGEIPNNVINVGALGIENINKLDLLTREELEKKIKFKLSEVNFLITFHPVTLENNSSQDQILELLNCLEEFKNAHFIFTLPNSDMDGRIIIHEINKFVNHNQGRSISFISMGQLLYLSTIKYMSVVIGNSSSGIIEVPSFKIPSINIGDRQMGRLKSKSIIDCEPNKSSIKNAINKALSKSFNKSLENMENIYGKGNSSSIIINTLESINLTNILKKPFNDIKI